MKKRVFSALLCLVMVIGLLPGIALADQKAAPEAPAATQIPMTYTVYCEKHGSESVNLAYDAFEIGEVTKVEGEYVCPITIYTKAFAEDYSAKHGEHAALAEKVTFNMKWDGLKWRDPAMTELPMIKLACAPEAPAATLIPQEYLVGCACYVDETVSMSLLPDTFEMGEVAMVDGKFVCPFTITTAPYVEEYSKKTGVQHVAEFETVTFNMTWDGLKWVVPEENELFIAAFCVPAMTAIPTQYIVSCGKHDAMQMNLIWDTFTIGEVAKEGDKFVCPVTIKTAPYAEAYSAKYGKHEAAAETITFNMTWNYQEEKWEAPEMTEMPTINVECVAPAAPAMTAIPTEYIVSCEKHGGEMTNLLPDTFTIGEVAEVEGQYVCPVTIATEKYAEAYSTREHGKHVAKAETITFNMTWNGEAWEAPEMTEMPAINVECVVPAAPAANELPARYFVSCEKQHKSAWMFEIPGTVEIGEVTQQPSGDYVCTITVSTADYAEEYSKACGEHKATVDSVSYTMAWNGRKWVAPAYAELPVIALECVVTEPEAPEAPAATELPMGYMVKCNQGRLFHGARFIYQQPESFTIGEVEKVGDTYVCTVTVGTEQYAKAYSNCWGIRKTHTAVDKTISFTMTWDGEQWVAPAYTELPVIYVACARTNSWFPMNFHWLKW